MAENVELAEGIMRWLIEGHAALSTPVMLKGDLAPEVQRKVAAGLQAVDRVLLLQSSPLLKGATGTQLLRLASSARRHVQGWRRSAGEHDRTVDVDRAHRHARGHHTGWTHRIGRLRRRDRNVPDARRKPLGATVSATTDGTALRFTRTDLFEVLGDETALLQSVFAGLLHTASRGAPEVQPASPA